MTTAIANRQLRAKGNLNLSRVDETILLASTIVPAVTIIRCSDQDREFPSFEFYQRIS